ncbi:MAG: TRAP transporter small permease [Fusobacteriaceae bacterium]|jgi:TRAP-type C4-dicarboxylate transport system permease small subunit|nr:TRAP transporter small permease [Fusobacteriaceae bacterium]
MDRIVNFLIVIFFAMLILSCVLQVFTRYVMNSALTWTEELARFTFIWANLLGAVFCTKKGSHATVTALSDFFPPGAKRIVQILIQALILAIAVVMIRYGIKVTYLTRNQTSAAMKISMALVNASVPFCGVMIFVHALIRMLQLLFATKAAKGGDA